MIRIYLGELLIGNKIIWRIVWKNKIKSQICMKYSIYIKYYKVPVGIIYISLIEIDNNLMLK